MLNPTPLVSCRYGAPMGRRDDMIDYGARLYLRRVPLDSGGYDPGGAYWGLGSPLWAYGDGEGWCFIRASSRRKAAALIEEESDVVPIRLKRPVTC
jgi:hypothetical protein